MAFLGTNTPVINDHMALANQGSYSHAQIDSFITAINSGGKVYYGTQASRPAATSVNAGSVYFPTDGYYPAISNGHTWGVQAIPGVAVTNPPSIGAFKNLNFGTTTTLTADGDGLLMTTLGASFTVINAAVGVIPVTGAYSLTAGIDLGLYSGGAGVGGAGICVTDGIGTAPKLTAFIQHYYGNSFTLCCSIINCTDLATSHDTPFQRVSVPPMASGKYFCRIRDDRTTNLYYEISSDLRNWYTLYTQARTAWLVPAYMGLVTYQSSVGLSGTQTLAFIKLFHWSFG